MKPKDILDAMNDISEEYITEAKPTVGRNGESRAITKQTDTNTETVSAGGHGSSRQSVQKRRSRKESSISMSTVQPIWQRVTTGIVAAAACTVFIGGGWFIAQQAKQSHELESAAGKEEKYIRNFLGGSGAIQVAGDMKLMYDVNRVYLNRAEFEAARTGKTLDDMWKHSDCNNIFFDGEQFYRLEYDALYRIDLMGKHMDKAPFYTIDPNTPNPSYSGATVTEWELLEIKKLADDTYFISIGIQTTNIETSRTDCFIYHPSRKQQDMLPSDSQIIPYDDNHAIISHSLGEMYRITYEPYNETLVSDDVHLKSGDTNWTAENGSLYFMVNDTNAGSVTGKHDYEPDSYGKINLETGEYTELVQNMNFRDFVPYDGKIYAVADGGNTLICANPDWTEVETLYDFQNDMPKQIQKELPQAKQDEYSIPLLYAVDENYFEIQYNYHHAVTSYLLIDRHSGEMRFLTEGEAPVEEIQEITDTNVLGGTGAIHAAGNYGELMYDNDRVYLSFGRQDNQNLHTIVPRFGDRFGGAVNQTVPQTNQSILLNDGKNLYQQVGEVLYRIGADGKPESEVFFAPTVEEIKRAMDFFSQDENYDGTISASPLFWIKRLTDDYYFINYRLFNCETGTDIKQLNYEWKQMDFGFLYNAKTDERTECEDIIGAFEVFGIDDNTFYYQAASTGTIYALSLEPDVSEKEKYTQDTSDPLILSKDYGNYLKDGFLYYMCPNDSADNQKNMYCKLNLKTKEYSIVSDKQNFERFIPFEDQLYARSSAGNQIICFDAELKNQTVVIDFEKDVPAEIRDTVTAAAQKHAQNNTSPLGEIISLDCVDENYILCTLADESKLLYDRQNSAVHCYLDGADDIPAPNSDEASEKEQKSVKTEAYHSDIENIFGGWGELTPMYQNAYENTCFYRDDVNFYFAIPLDYKTLQWYSTPSGGGEIKKLPQRILGAQTYTGSLLSDGSSIYTENLSVVTEGRKGALHFELKDACKGLLPNASDSMSCKLVNIWHVQDRYFIVVEWQDQNDNGYVTAWINENGELLNNRLQDGINKNKVYFCDEEQENIYSILTDEAAQTSQIVEEAYGSVTALAAHLEEGESLHRFLISDGNKYVFSTTHGRLCSVDEDGNFTQLDKSGFTPEMCVDANGMIYYCKECSDTTSGIYKVSAAGGEPALIYEAPAYCFKMLGLTSSEASHTPFYLLISSVSNSYEVGYKIIDPTDGTVIRDFQIPD